MYMSFFHSEYQTILRLFQGRPRVSLGYTSACGCPLMSMEFQVQLHNTWAIKQLLCGNAPPAIIVVHQTQKPTGSDKKVLDKRHTTCATKCLQPHKQHLNANVHNTCSAGDTLYMKQRYLLANVNSTCSIVEL